MSELQAEQPAKKKRHFKERLVWVVVMTAVLLFSFYMSLLVTSDDLGFQEREVVGRAAEILQQKGFSKEAFVIKHLARYRSTDNWLNAYVGHRDAYAATNFPFEVLTLYPEFFNVSVDDEERAAILLHEAYHLMGYGEQAALEAVWKNKNQLGWTGAKYSQTRVWKNTRELTMTQVPNLFRCGPNRNADCFE